MTPPHDDFEPSGFDVLDASLETRFEKLHQRVGKIETRFDGMEERFAKVEIGLNTNNEATKRIETNTSDLIDFFNSAKGAFKVLDWIGKFAKPVSAIIGLGTAIYAAFQIGSHLK